MEHMECFLSSLPQTLALIRAVEVSLSGHSPTADFSCFSRSFLQGKLQNLATLQKVLRHRKKHSGQLWLWGLCLVLHMSLLASHIWKCYVKQSKMFHSDNIWNWKPLTNMVIEILQQIQLYIYDGRNQNTHVKLYCACLMDSFFIPLAWEWWVTLWRWVSRSHSAWGTLAVWQCEVWFLRPPGELTGGPRSLCFGGQTLSHGWLD